MTKSQKFALTTTWILFSRSYDAYCTHQLTPDLSKEANPLVSVVGISSWTPLLLILGILTLYILYAYYISLFKPMNLKPMEKGYSFGNFIAYQYLGKKAHWTSTFYQLPKDRKRLHHYLGCVLSPCLVYAGIVSTLMWLLIHYSDSYRQFHQASLIYFLFIAGCASIVYRWNRVQFQEYQAAV